VDETTHQPLLSTLALIVETATKLRKNGYKVVIVSSGAIGIALQKMGLPRRPKHLPQVQALAAIGQCRLIGLWDQLFDRLGQPVAQILLTRNDIADRTQYLNAQNTLFELLNMGVIPIVNENDTIAVSEIVDKFGDNDTLSAITAGMIQADYLFLMTDVDCLYDKNPRTHSDAKAIEVVENIADLDVDISSAGSSLGTGGMSTKIVAARLATAAGVTTVIARSSKPGNILDVVSYIETKKTLQRAPANHSAQSSNSLSTLGFEVSSAREPPETLLALTHVPLHTRFLPSTQPVRDRHFWLLHGLRPHGTLYIDHGAVVALRDKAGLLPVGVVHVEGAFAQQECVRLVEIAKRKITLSAQVQTPATGLAVENTASAPSSSQDTGQTTQTTDATNTPTLSGPVPFTLSTSLLGRTQPHIPSDPAAREIGRALVNYSAAEIRLIAGRRSTEIQAVLGYADSEYVALRENVAILGVLPSRPSTPTTSMVAVAVGKGLAGYVEG